MMRWHKLCLLPSPVYVFIYSKFHALVSIIMINQYGRQLNVGRKWGFLVLTWDSPLQLQRVGSTLLFLLCQICLVLFFTFLLSRVLCLPISVGLAQLRMKVRAHTEELICGYYPLPAERLYPRAATASCVTFLMVASCFLAFCFSLMSPECGENCAAHLEPGSCCGPLWAC